MDRPSRTTLLHLGVMVAVLALSLAVIGIAAGPLGASFVGGSPSGSERADHAREPGQQKDKADKQQAKADKQQAKADRQQAKADRQQAKADRQKDRAAKGPEIQVTLTGSVGTRTVADGSTEYTLTSGADILTLDAGPAWFFTSGYPLASYVGKQVTIGGERSEGSSVIEVLTVDGMALREPGRPPWAGGWKTVGERHPGWSKHNAEPALTP